MSHPKAQRVKIATSSEYGKHLRTHYTTVTGHRSRNQIQEWASRKFGGPDKVVKVVSVTPVVRKPHV